MYLIPVGNRFDSVPTFLGKDRIIFVTKEDHDAPSNAELIADDPNDPYEEQGLSLLLPLFGFLFTLNNITESSGYRGHDFAVTWW